MAPFAAQAETINIYGWQNYSWEFVDIEGGRSFDRIGGNAANIGFSANVETGMNDINVTLQCESWTLHNHWHGNGGWCTRNSKIGLSHPQAGEIMFATWLLPYNEAVAQWIDPFYDAGADSHTSIMGGVGGSTIYHSPGYFGNPRNTEGRDPRYAIGLDTGFNRRQEEIIQYFSPNWNGFKVRFAWTAGYEDENTATNGTDTAEVDPVIRSASLVYENGPLWLATTWQDHEDWTASRTGMKGTMTSSDSESFRLAARYIFDLGDGMSVQIGAMWEDLEYEFNNVSSVNAAMNAFYLTAFDKTGNMAMPGQAETDAQTTYGLMADLFPGCTEATKVRCPTQFSTLTFTAPTADDPSTDAKDPTDGNYGTDVTVDSDANTADVQNALADALVILRNNAAGKNDAGDADLDLTQDANVLIRDNAMHVVGMIDGEVNSRARAMQGAGDNVKIERDAWMVSGKIKFGGPVDFRFSYMDADDLEVSCGACSGDWDETAADAWNVGVFYTMPSGTELRLTYSEVNNDDNGSYVQGVTGTGYGTQGFESEMFAVGIVHWFD